MVLRLLATASECYLHSRLPDCHKKAKDTATEALRWAINQELSPALAHRWAEDTYTHTHTHSHAHTHTLSLSHSFTGHMVMKRLANARSRTSTLTCP